MPRRTTSPTMLIVNYFLSTPIAEAKQALDTARAIVSTREAAGLQQPVLPTAQPAKPRRARRPRQASLPVEGATAAAVPAGDVAARPRRRRGRPPVVDSAAPGEPAAPSSVDLAALPAPTE